MNKLITDNQTCECNIYVSTKDSLISVTIADGCASDILKTLSITDSSVLVVSSPQNALQSLTTIPAPITSLPRLTVPAYINSSTVMINKILTTSGTCSNEDNSS